MAGELNECTDYAGLEPLSEVCIADMLYGRASSVRLSVFSETDSTNSEAKRRTSNGENAPQVILAESQTAGRGRFGRSFYSPEGCGLYMSAMISPPEGSIAAAGLFTTAAAVAVCRAVERLGGPSLKIKWVNDLYFNSKKVCGILAEAVPSPLSGSPPNIIIGIGINIVKGAEPLPEEISHIAGAVFENNPPFSRNRLAAEIINILFDMMPRLSEKEFMTEYRERSMLIGKEVVYFRGNKKTAAVVEGIDDDGALLVVYEDGSREALGSGEVSVRAAENQDTLPEPLR